MIRFLENIVEFLKLNPIELKSKNDDGRINSAINEKAIITSIAKEFSQVKISKMREWYDFSIQNGDEIFVNVKISDLNNDSADNCSSKLGMGYALCGQKDMPIRWDCFHSMLANELKIGYDYYFLIVNAKDSRDCFWTSLKRIKTLVPNGNNLPFQCDWSKNREFSNRTEIEAMKYILSVYIESWDKKVLGYPFELKEMLLNNKLLDNE